MTPTGRTKERRNVKPDMRELRHMVRVMELPCLVCLIEPCGVAHHILQDCMGKKWRRNHEFVVPLCHGHHSDLHARGSELAWQEDYKLDLAKEAEFLRLESQIEGIL